MIYSVGKESSLIIAVGLVGALVRKHLVACEEIPCSLFSRVEPIVLKVLCYAALLKKCAIYAHEIVKLCSKMCLTDTGLIFAVHANGQSDWIG